MRPNTKLPYVFVFTLTTTDIVCLDSAFGTTELQVLGLYTSRLIKGFHHDMM